MRRRLLLAGCALAWGLTALFGAAELFFICCWVYYGNYAAENMRAAEDAGTAGFFAMMLLPLFLLAAAVCGASTYGLWKHWKESTGQTPVGKR